MLRGRVFLGSITLKMREVSGNHWLFVTWKVAHPACMERICVQFPDDNIDEYCVDNKLFREAGIAGLPCNTHINVQVAVYAIGLIRILPAGSVYIGGIAKFQQ